MFVFSHQPIPSLHPALKDQFHRQAQPKDSPLASLPVLTPLTPLEALITKTTPRNSSTCPRRVLVRPNFQMLVPQHPYTRNLPHRHRPLIIMIYPRLKRLHHLGQYSVYRSMILLRRDGSAIPLVVYQCLQAVDLFGLEVEGIYRLSGSAAHVAKLRAIFDNGKVQMTMNSFERT